MIIGEEREHYPIHGSISIARRERRGNYM